MKTKLQFVTGSALILLVMLPGCGQVKVPDAAKSAFNQKFPTAQFVKWGEEKEDNAEAIYEAEFKLNGKEMSANFDTQGKWMETESELKESDLTAAILAGIKDGHSGFSVKEVAKVETPEKGVAFEVVIKKGKELFELIFDESGKLLLKEDLNKEEGDEAEENENEEK